MIEDLPYKLPVGSDRVIVSLCNVIDIPYSLLLGKGREGENILCGVILYRHLGMVERQEVMKMIYSQEDKSLVSKLVTKITDTIVNPNWGLWSLTNPELQARKQFHGLIQKWSSVIGVGATLASSKEFLSKVWRQKRYLSVGNVLTIIVWGGLLCSNKMLSDVSLEQERRKIQINTKYH